jgi:hypothetical protein
MPDIAVGYVLLGVGILVVLGIVFAAASRGGGGERAGATPPRGVHMPGPSYLPVAISISAALIGAALAFRGDGQLANPFLAILGVAVFVAVSVAWVRAANHEWRDTEHGSHDDGASH